MDVSQAESARKAAKHRPELHRRRVAGAVEIGIEKSPLRDLLVQK